MHGNRQWYENRAAMVKEYGEPPFTPEQSLRHALKMYANQPDDEHVVRATSGIFDKGVVTGLTWGDLRALAKKLGIDFQ